MMSDGDIKVYDKEAKCEMMGMSLSLEHQNPLVFVSIVVVVGFIFWFSLFLMGKIQTRHQSYIVLSICFLSMRFR